jgi:hypothetical protein
MRALLAIFIMIISVILVASCQLTGVNSNYGSVDDCFSSSLWKSGCDKIIYQSFVGGVGKCEEAEAEVEYLRRRHGDRISAWRADYLYDVVNIDNNQRMFVYVIAGSVIDELYSLNIELTLSASSCLKLDMAEIVQ